MPTYSIQVSKTTYGTISVQADSSDEATITDYSVIAFDDFDPVYQIVEVLQED
jgi:hypothetical protein